MAKDKKGGKFIGPAQSTGYDQKSANQGGKKSGSGLSPKGKPSC